MFDYHYSKEKHKLWESCVIMRMMC